MVTSWGSNEDGRLGRELTGEQTWTATADILPKIPSTIMDVSAGGDHNLALEYNGVLYSWGNNRDGQLGLGNSTTNLSILEPQANERYLMDADVVIRSISAGSGYGAISDATGQVYGIGDYTKGRYQGGSSLILRQNDTLGDTPIIVGEKGQPSSKHQVLVQVGEDVVVDFVLSKRFNLYTEFWNNYPIKFRNVNPNVGYRNESIILEEGKEYTTGQRLSLIHI